jgi:hypothetical protein
MKNKKIPHCRNISKIKTKSWKETQSIPQTQMHVRSLSWIGTGTSINSGGGKSVLCPPEQFFLNASELVNSFHSKNTQNLIGH